MPWPQRSTVKESAGAAGLHLLLALAVFFPAFLTGDVLFPSDLLRTIYPWGSYMKPGPSHNPALLDVVQQFYPWFLFFRDELLAGRFPLWNPQLGLGLPHAANPLTASYFPLSFLALLGATGWNLLLVLRLVVSGTGTYLLLRRLGMRRISSALGSVAFAYSEPLFSYLADSTGNVDGLLPWLFLAALHAGDRATVRSAVPFGAAMALMHFGGQPEATAFFAPAAVVAGIAGRRTSPARALRVGGILLAAGVAGTAAAAVHLLPFLDSLRCSRALLDPEARTLVLPLSGLVTWIVPSFFGDAPSRLSWQGMPPVAEFRCFAGSLVFGLAFAGLVLRRARRWAVPGVLVLLGVSLPFGLPPLSFLTYLPVIERARTQRILPLAALGVAWLAALAIDRISAFRRSGRRAAVARASAATFVPLLAAALLLLFLGSSQLPAVVGATAGAGLLRAGVLLALGAFLGLARISEGVRAVGLCLVVLGDCCGAAFGFHGAEPRPTAFFGTGLGRLLESRETWSRVLPLGYTLPPNTQLSTGIASILSYDAVDDQRQVLFLRHLGGYAGKSSFTTVWPDRIRNPRVLELAAVRYLLADPQSPRLDTGSYRALSGLSLKRVYHEADGTVYELETARPLVWGAGTAEVDPGLVRFEERLQAADAALLRTPFVDATEVPSGDGAPVEVSPARRAGGEIAVDVAAEGVGWIFVAEGGFPSWRATVDGSETPVYRASGPFQALVVPRGAHRVVLRYAPASFRAGLLVSIAGFLALAAMAVAGDRRIRPA